MLLHSVDKKSFAYKMTGMTRRPLTPEEEADAKRLAYEWAQFRMANPSATQSWLAAASGLGTQGAVSQYLRGAIPLNVHALTSICRVINADPYYISPRLMSNLFGAQPVALLSEESQPRVDIAAPRLLEPMRQFTKVEAAGPGDPRLTLIPKVRLSLTAGITGFAMESEEYESSTTAVPTEWIDRKGYSPENLIAIHVRGESMEPTFYEGDLVVLNTADTRPVDGGVYAINYEGESVVKRMSRDAGDWWLTSDNLDQRKYHRKVCRGDACIVIGRIVRRETERF